MSLRLHTEAIVCALRTHGEHGGIVRLLTAEHGLVAAYVRGARGRRMRPILIPGNLVSAELRSRTDGQLPQASIELVRSRAPILSEPLTAAAVDWAGTLIVATLPERQPYPDLYSAASAFLDAVEAAPAASGWAGALVRLELLVVAELGYARALPSLPESIRRGAGASWSEVMTGLEISGRLLERDVLAGASASVMDSRMRLAGRLKRAAR
jgi:DNA repair protein RecO (recombination protein O)